MGAIAAKNRAALALQSDGTVAQWGEGLVSPPAGLSNVVAIAAGPATGTAVKQDGTLAVWGQSFYPAAPMALNGSSDVVAAAVGIDFGLALRTDSMVTHGTHIFGGPFGSGLTTLAGWSNGVAISANTCGLGLKSDSTVLGYGFTPPVGLTNVASISAGYEFSLLLTTNPPAPLLMARSSGGDVSLSAPVSVSGYVLEAADNLSGRSRSSKPSPTLLHRSATRRMGPRDISDCESSNCSGR